MNNFTAKMCVVMVALSMVACQTRSSSYLTRDKNTVPPADLNQTTTPTSSEPAALSHIELKRVGTTPLAPGDCLHLELRFADQQNQLWVLNQPQEFEVRYDTQALQPAMDIDCMAASSGSSWEVQPEEAKAHLYFYVRSAGQHSVSARTLHDPLESKIEVSVDALAQTPAASSGVTFRSMAPINALEVAKIEVKGIENVKKSQCQLLELQVVDQRADQTNPNARFESPGAKLKLGTQEDLSQAVFFEDQDCTVPLAGGRNEVIMAPGQPQAAVYLWIPDEYASPVVWIWVQSQFDLLAPLSQGQTTQIRVALESSST
ncbi:MAG: hypothetical protein R3A11_04565 [Bdellovibrionota bacterium]